MKDIDLKVLKQNPEKIQKLLDEVYLGLGDTSDLIFTNPLNPKSQFDIEHPHIHLLSLMRKPEYFPITCKWLFGIDLLPFQAMILRELWNTKFPMLVASRGAGKTFLLSLYALLRGLFDQKSKVVIVGAAFRQSKLLFEYMETFWRDSPILQHIVGKGKQQGPRRDIDRCTFYLGNSVVTAIPLGNGEKIRGLRANVVLCDEFASVPEEIFETVVGGFGAVNLSPVEAVKHRAKIDLLKQFNMWNEEMQVEEESLGMGNQTVISGTAYYSFNHFAKYHRKWHDIIKYSRDQKKLEEIFNGEVPESFNPKHYTILRLPYHILPKGFMDESTVSRAKATIHSSIYQMEYGASFAADSNGFFKKSLIESCVCTNLEDGQLTFSAMVRGNPNGTYVYGVDPASETDNFAIVIIEKHGDHSRVVYSWTMNRKKHRERISKKVIDEHDFYSYCCRKIRDLMKIFPTEHIGIDAQGGGRAIMENLQDPNKLKDGEQRLLPYTARKDDEFWWEKPDKDTDGEQGLHIIHAIEFANSTWTSEANHGLRMDFEQKKTLFPHFDPWVIEESIAYDKSKGITEETYSLHDTLEDCVLEIQELKDELTTIEYTQTGIQGRDKWDTPEEVKKNGRKGRLRKDRYSALVIANMISRTIIREIPSEKYQGIGGFAGKDYTDLKTKNANPYYGNAKHVNRLPIVGMVVKRNGV